MPRGTLTTPNGSPRVRPRKDVQSPIRLGPRQQLAPLQDPVTRAGLFDEALTNMPHGLCMFDDNRRLILCNPAYSRLYNLPPELTKPGTSVEAILEYRAGIHNAPVNRDTYLHVVDNARKKGDFLGNKVALQDGRTIQITHNPMPQGGYVATHEDITGYMLAEAQIHHLATHDALTGLPNRTTFFEQFDLALTNVTRSKRLAIHCLDLDHFKGINDTFGHAIGDLLLQSATDRFLACVREIDTVARLGGDEFVILQVDVDQPEDARTLASRLVDEFSKPFVLDGHQVVSGVSVGIAFSPKHGISAESVLRSADVALYRAKLDGRNTFRFFEFEMDTRLQARRRLEMDIREALVTGTFELHYQPLVNAATADIKGFEALLRWTHPERGQVNPLDFIPVAEETGLIVPIGIWVLERACKDAMFWPDYTKVAVNLSPVQFRNGKLVETVRSVLAATGLPPSRLELEITESVLLIESEATLATLYDLKAMGVGVALDDFGTGYSSLSYLRSFPFDKIKIDKSFIQRMADSTDCAAIVRAVAGLGAALNMTTTAEGVETSGQLQHVREHGCNEVQGYLYGAAVSAEGTLKLLRSGRHLGSG